ncbi:MAG: DUF1015 domain-containing protein, partial [Acidobacteria bacterium]|nr:DUF1015 domain-containing protein [Acidobacteriota bacterium]
MDLFPFRALRFRTASAGRLDRLISPPYDVIRPGERRTLERRSRFNIVHLTLPRGGTGRYARAAALLRLWCREGILAPDPVPAFYPAEQEFRIGHERRTRFGFFALVGLGGAVLPHEATFRGPRCDRTRILQACRADLEPILLLYSDPAGTVERILRKTARGRALTICRESQGSRLRLWRVAEGASVLAVRRALRRRQVLIADGHHRFASAAAYWRGGGRGGGSGTGPAILAFLSRVEDSGVVSLPTHRLVSGLDASRLAELPLRLERRFRLEPFPTAVARRSIRAWRDLLRRLQARDAGVDFAVVLPGSRAGFLARGPAGKGRDRTGVERLEAEVMGPMLGIGPGSERRYRHVDYQRDPRACLDAVASGQAQAAFLLPSLPARRVLAIARRGRLLPQKST